MSQPSRTPITDEDLLPALKQGDPAAWQALCERYGEALYRFAYYRCGSNPAAADDIRQETLLAAVDNIGRFRGDAPLFGWLCGIARNKAADYLRRTMKAGDPLPDEVENGDLGEWLESGGPLPDEILERGETRAALVEALWTLPDNERKALVDRYVRDCSVDEIARRQQRTYKAAESLLSRARQSLRKRLKEVLEP